MSSKKGILLKVDPEKRININDVISMLKGLRDETFFKELKSSDEKIVKYQLEGINSKNKTNKKIKSNHVTGNTDLPQIRELNEIAALLRSMENGTSSF